MVDAGVFAIAKVEYEVSVDAARGGVAVRVPVPLTPARALTPGLALVGGGSGPSVVGRDGGEFLDDAIRTREQPLSHDGNRTTTPSGTAPTVTLRHGTNVAGRESIDANGIQVGRTAMADDFGVAFYMTEETGVAASSAARTGVDPMIGEVSVSLEDLGSIVDIRPGGAHAKLWQELLASKVPGIGKTWGQLSVGMALCLVRSGGPTVTHWRN